MLGQGKTFDAFVKDRDSLQSNSGRLGSILVDGIHNAPSYVEDVDVLESLALTETELGSECERAFALEGIH